MQYNLHIPGEKAMPQFTSGELEVMRILWEFGELKPAEIQARFNREIKNPALRSYLTILLEKGHVTRRHVGKAYFYKPKTRQQTAFRGMLRELADEFWDGSIRSLLFSLVESEKLNQAEIDELSRLAKEKKASGRKRKKS